jgi:membrane-associated protease RseP (regulator of RpoE activity)
MAFVLLWSILALVGLPTSGTVQISALESWQGVSTPAARAGLHPGDVVLAVNGRTVRDFNGLSNVIGKDAGRPVQLTILRGGRNLMVTVVPADGTEVRTGGKPVVSAGSKEAGSPGRIGVLLQPEVERQNPLASLGRAGVDLGHYVTASITGLWTVFSPHGLAQLGNDLVSSKAAEKAAQAGTRPESIYGAVRTATQGAQAGVGYLLEVLVSINVFVGLLNLFPMLPLDGGHVVIAVYERMRTRRGRRYRADVAKLAPLSYAVLGVLAFVVVSALYLDIVHPVANRFG